jgi:hypothetical protein
MRRFSAILILLLLSPLLLALVLLGLPLVFGFWVLELVALRIRCGRSGNWCYLVCSRRHEWNEFVVNNVAPALPRGIELLWYEERLTHSLWSGLGMIQRCGFGLPKPYLARVSLFRIRCRSIHQVLLPYKAYAARNERISTQIRLILAAEACQAA